MRCHRRGDIAGGQKGFFLLCAAALVITVPALFLLQPTIIAPNANQWPYQHTRGAGFPLATVIELNGTNYTHRIDGNPNRKPYLFISGPGRLGNHMFQYASGYAIAMATNHTAVVDPSWELDRLFGNMDTVVKMKAPSRKSLPAKLWTLSEAAAGIFNPDLLRPSPDVDAATSCYLQSWRYFAQHESLIRWKFTFRDDIKVKAQDTIRRQLRLYVAKVNGLKESQRGLKTSRNNVSANDVTVIGVHIRRQDTTLVSMVDFGYKAAPESYITSALEYYRLLYNNTLFLVSTDDESWSSRYVISRHADSALVASADARLDLAVLAQCNHSVITAGTFGWWAGWIANGDVIYYKDWPNPKSKLDNYYSKADYFPPHWIGL